MEKMKKDRGELEAKLINTQGELKDAVLEVRSLSEKLRGQEETNSELEELLWNYLVLSMKLSSDSWNAKWNSLSILKEKVREQRIPYKRWSEFILQELDNMQTAPPERAHVLTSQGRRHTTSGASGKDKLKTTDRRPRSGNSTLI
jgi:hypothetical protein